MERTHSIIISGLVVVLSTSWIAGCQWLTTGSGRMGIVRPVVQSPTPETSVIQAGALAMGNAIVGELKTNLLAAGLTEAETKIVAESSQAEIAIAAGTLAIPTSLHLLELNPIIYVAGPAVKGALKALDEAGVNLSDPIRRVAIAEVVMASTVGSLGGRVQGLSSDAVISLQKEMVGAGVTTLNDAGLGGDSAANGIKALTSGAVASASKSVDSGFASQAAASIVSGAVENIGKGGLPTDQIQNIVSSAVAGVVTQLQKTGVSDTAEAASLVAKSSVESLRVLSLPVEKLIDATEGAAKGAVSALTAAGVSKEAMGPAAQKIATSSAAALKAAGIPDDRVGQAAGAVASGAILGMGAAGLSASEMTTGQAIASIVAGATSGMAASGLAADQMTTALGSVAQIAIGSLAKMSTVAPTLDLAAIKSQIISEVIQGTISQAIASGIATAATISNVTSSVAAGAGQGLATLEKAGVEVTQAAGTIQDATQSVLNREQSKINLDPSQISSIATNAGQTAEASKTVASSNNTGDAPPRCSLAFPDTLTDDSFRSMVEPLATPPSCSPESAGSCPRQRVYNRGSAAWVALPNTTLCQLVLKRPDMPLCSGTFPDTLSDADFRTLMEGKMPQGAEPPLCQRTSSVDCPKTRTYPLGVASWGAEFPHICVFQFSSNQSDNQSGHQGPPSCTDLFAAQFGTPTPSPITNALLGSTSSRNDFGDVTCTLPLSTPCLGLAQDVTTHQFAAFDDVAMQVRFCHYTHQEPQCDQNLIEAPPSATAGLLTVPITAPLTSGMHPWGAPAPVAWACRMTDPHPLPRLDPTLSSQGFVATKEGVPNGTRLVIRRQALPCPLAGSGNAISGDHLRKMTLVENRFEFACEIPSSGICPNLDSINQTLFELVQTTAFSTDQKRCLFIPKTTTCPATIGPDLASSDLNPLVDPLDGTQDVYHCQKSSTTCPSASSDGTLIFPAPGQTTSSQRCVYAPIQLNDDPPSMACAQLFPDRWTSRTDLTDSDLTQSPGRNEFGDVRCVISADQTCLDTSSTLFRLFNNQIAVDSEQTCHYIRHQDVCPDLTALLTPTLVSAMSPLPFGNGRACQRETLPTVRATLDSTLINQGYFTELAYTPDSQARVLLRQRARLCPPILDTVYYGSVFKMSMVDDTGERACDVPLEAQCSSLPANAPYLLRSVEFSSLNIRRCYYKDVIPPTVSWTVPSDPPSLDILDQHISIPYNADDTGPRLRRLCRGKIPWTSEEIASGSLTNAPPSTPPYQTCWAFFHEVDFYPDFNFNGISSSLDFEILVSGRYTFYLFISDEAENISSAATITWDCNLEQGVCTLWTSTPPAPPTPSAGPAVP